MLAAALSEEAALSPVGREVARRHLLRLLENRLRVEGWHRRHPEIAEQETRAPIFVLGLPRTGTTALSARLARDPGLRALRTWESAEPTPPPELATAESDPRIERARKGLEAMHAAFPEMRLMYDAEATDPTECQDLLGMELRTHHFAGQYWIPSYAAWLLEAGLGEAYRVHRRVLQLLQWRCPPNRWMLKTPLHMLSLDELVRVYPDARFVMTHRDPAAVLGSVCALVQVTRSMASDRRDPTAIGREQMELWPLALERALAFRDRVGEERFADVHFAEQLADPVGVVERAWRKLGLPFTEEARAAMEAFARRRPRGRHGTYRYRLGDFGLRPEEVRERFGPYLERFDVEIEEVEA